jgi:hypothetical protein
LKEIRDSFCASTSSPHVAIIGDSHAGHLFWGFVHSGDPYFSETIVIGAGSCPPAFGVEMRQGCTQAIGKAVTMVNQSPQVGHVLLGAYYDFFKRTDEPSAQAMFRGYLQMFSTLEAARKRVAFVRDPPTLRSEPGICIPMRPVEIAYPAVFWPPSFCSGASERDLRDHAAYNQFVDALAAAAPEVFFYDPADALCRGGSCRVYDDNRKLLYGDFNHLSIYGSEYVVRDLVSRLKVHDAARAAAGLDRQ